jgi:hypothetical protein
VVRALNTADGAQVKDGFKAGIAKRCSDCGLGSRIAGSDGVVKALKKPESIWHDSSLNLDTTPRKCGLADSSSARVG